MEFATWCRKEGFVVSDAQIDYIVLRVQNPSKPTNPMMGVWYREHMPEHLTVDYRLIPIVRRFIKETKDA
jgi:hypothetical protein